MSVKISELDEADELYDGCCFPIVQLGETKKITFQQLKAQLLEVAFPIGSTYTTQTDTNPNSILGFGIWERIKGKVLVGLDENDVAFNTIGKTGGEKTHTLTVNEIPAHNHEYEMTHNEGNEGWSKNGNWESYGKHTTNNTGGGQPHNNLQPYEVVGYMWIRRN